MFVARLMVFFLVTFADVTEVVARFAVARRGDVVEVVSRCPDLAVVVASFADVAGFATYSEIYTARACFMLMWQDCCTYSEVCAARALFFIDVTVFATTHFEVSQNDGRNNVLT